ncbi:hypothetical protein LRR18_05510 [Mangrovimonas sp. AS39]|uniref:hypothetical protein n=1 Tax=Mangrovimonas TaxID=1211036 RepID=UPI00141E24EE|nr:MULTISPECIES: hypothetical protein [Mangrovimonas]MCF1191035.1 hypothetical protein [Mangrovimonas futianensis]MCF1194730.1 hypothetical protein [Mangrovimonas futianensis]MCF1420494.1 hypothetical protein [Mangrovimonas futianensis]NIK91581.1 hypothetical protein [Mangrovimonas sp. CR14]
MKKIITTFILILGLTITGFSQSDNMKEKAMEKVNELNEQIVEGDKSLALSKEQKDQVYELHLARLQELKIERKAGGDQDKMKAINKKYFKQIFNDVLTKDQKKARKKGKDQMSED